MKSNSWFSSLLLLAAAFPPPGIAQDFSGTWTLYANGYKLELYLKQEGNNVRGWMGVNGVNIDQDVIAGTVTGKEIRFTRSSPHLLRPQEYRGFILIHDQPQIEARTRMTGADALAGIASHLGEWNFGWYANRSGPYRDDVVTSTGTWRLVGNGDCSGHSMGDSSGPNPDPARCNPSFSGFTAVCWDNNCNYKNIATGSCTGGAYPGRMYTCVTSSR